MNQNTFAQNINTFTEKANDAISALTLLTETFISDETTVDISIAGKQITYPSYNTVLSKLNSVENTVNSFTSGNGNVKLIDGTNRKIKVSTMPSTPKNIDNIDPITTFNINSNWFFEDLMYPKMVVSLNLKDKVDDDSDRIKVMRVIIDTNKQSNYIINFYNNNLKDKSLSYPELIEILESDSNISYYEDDEIIDFPLIENEFIGNFEIINKEIIDGKVWYYLDTLYYSVNNIYDKNNINNIILKNGDSLIFEQSIYKIVDIDILNKKIQIESYIGFDTIGIGSTVKYYNDPFRNKNIQIPVGINEINCIFLKGINENYNLLGDKWSNMISFISNDLVFVDNSNITFEQYYNTYVADFGAEWIAEAKERKISAYNGKKPNAPILVPSDFKVVQINTQISSVLDNTEIKNTQSSIISLNSNIKSLRNTIAKQKNDLLKIKSDVTNSDDSESTSTARTALQEYININSSKLESLVTEYVSNVEFLNNKLKDIKYHNTNPKYRIRGFFPIPQLQYSYEYVKNGELIKEGKQDIIGFEIKYRYLKPDETGVNLTTFDYVDNNKNKVTAVFSDWNVVNSIFKEKNYNASTGVYEWRVENDADGSEININQIDIPITSGEKVEFCVRSISEAGYPLNPLKSEWSNSIIIEFPESLASSNQISNIIDDVNSEMTSIKLDDALKNAGYYSHIADELVVNENNLSRLYHHDAKNILCDINEKVNLYEVIKQLTSRIEELEKKIK